MKKGHWIKTGFAFESYLCSKCGFIWTVKEHSCPNCKSINEGSNYDSQEIEDKNKRC